MEESTLSRHDLAHADGRAVRIYGRYDGQQLPDDGPEYEPSAIHQRRNALRGTWVAVSPARNTRPHAPSAQAAATGCPLCVGGPELPFPYEAAVFDNRFPSFVPAAGEPPAGPALDGMATTAPSTGRCEVVLYTPTHTGSLATLTDEELARVVAIWTDRSNALWADPANKLVIAFENRGEDVGATLSHPHGQIYAVDRIPPAIAHRVAMLREHRARTGRSLPSAVVEADVASDRCIHVDEHFVVAVPFAPDWPFELHVRARREGVRRLGDLTPAERVSLALALRVVVTTYDRVHPTPMSYLMACHEAPADEDGSPEADHRLAFEFLPPHRSPAKLKIRATIETALGLFINDTLPEDSAAMLRASAPALSKDDRDSFPSFTVRKAPDDPAAPSTGRPMISASPMPEPPGQILKGTTE